ncbi:MAG: 50S ribosomal protein L34e [Candidatus Thorarchaeota archaeon]|jgi:large subunit ribosomal protein L34e
MPRPGMLTRSRANRSVKTPGGRVVVHRQKFYKSEGSCALTGVKMQLPRKAKFGISQRSSHSSKRPNRPYGGKATPKAVRRGIIRQAREL